MITDTFIYTQKFIEDFNALEIVLIIQSLPSQALLYPKINGAKNRQKIKGYEVHGLRKALRRDL